MRSKVMTMTFEQHLKNKHEFLQAILTMYPDKSVNQQPKKDKGKDTKK